MAQGYYRRTNTFETYFVGDGQRFLEFTTGDVELGLSQEELA
jgi:hypothetical protein